MIDDIRADVSRETIDRLAHYMDMLIRWNQKINLVSPATIADAEERHLADSLQLADLAPEGVKRWVDIGSGGGFPGLPLAILFAERSDPPEFILIESDQRKAAFLGAVIRETSVKARVVCGRAEITPSLGADIVSARAVASLERLLAYMHRHAKPGATGLFPKGRRWREELSLASQHWRFDHRVIPSRTDPESVIFEIGELRLV